MSKEKPPTHFKGELGSTLNKESPVRGIMACYDEDRCIDFFTPQKFTEIFKEGRVSWFIVKDKDGFRTFDRDATERLYQDMFSPIDNPNE